MKSSMRRVFLGIAALALGATACGSAEEAAKPIVFSVAQSTRSAMGAPESAAASDAAPNSKMAMAPNEVKYEVEGDLPALDGKAQSWKSVGEPTIKQMTAITRALGIDADPAKRSDDEGGGFVAGPTDGSAPSVSFSNPAQDAFAGWYYSTAWATSAVSSEPAIEPAAPDSNSASDAPVVDVPTEMKKPENLPTTDEARKVVQSILDEAGVDVRDGDIEIYADDWSVSVTAWPHAGDVRIPMSWTFGFGDGGAISWASGNLLSFEEGPKFPRVGAAAAVERLSDPKYSGWYGYGPVGRAVAEPAIADSATVQTVVITAVKESLTPIVDADNVLWLVPSYEYTVKDGYTIGVIAITDEFIEQAAPTVDSPIENGETIEPSPPIEGGGLSGSSGSSAGSGDTLPAVDAPTPTQEEAVALVGLTEDEATKVAESNGWIVRISSRDGEEFQLTMDYLTNRVNLAIADGKVTGVSVG
ncbi:MAG: hypothetical protein KJS66_06100 [Acidobacteria bacterium]|nr:hypothetical protein [Acidobacteriota bacterium]